MKAILLAAGYGTRLNPLTLKIPKCLVPIKKNPLLGIWLEKLSNANIGPFLINTHYLSKQVENFICEGNFQESVTLVYESELLGTAGTLIANLDFFGDDDGMLIHADNYCLADFKKFYQAHLQRPPECLITMMTFRAISPSNCGIVEINDNGVVVNFHEKTKNPPGNLANGAIYILSQELINMLKVEFKQAKDFSTEVLPFLLGRIYSFETTDVLLDIGTPESYELVKS